MSKKRKSILFIAYSGEQWMGGVYYVKNIVYQFLEYTKTVKEISYRVYIYLTEDVENVYSFCKDYKNVTFIYKRDSVFTKGMAFFPRNIRELQWVLRIYGRSIDYIFPDITEKSIYRKRLVSWIPDFQHVYFPDFFSAEENLFREQYYGMIAKKHSKLVLSSQNAFDTYKELYPSNMQGVGVVHFVSAIMQNELDGDFDEVVNKYNIKDKNFFIVSNQFYRHKNHMVLFKAIKELVDDGVENVQLVCTGMIKDVKDPTYFAEIDNYIKENELENNIRILGLISRKDQLTLMREAIAVIQPSLFEGWGTSAEDAKTLGKLLVLSDIDVHKEQADDKSVLFRRDSSEELASIIREYWSKFYGQRKEYEYCIKNAVEYGESFARLLEIQNK